MPAKAGFLPVDLGWRGHRQHPDVLGLELGLALMLTEPSRIQDSSSSILIWYKWPSLISTNLEQCVSGEGTASCHLNCIHIVPYLWVLGGKWSSGPFIQLSTFLAIVLIFSRLECMHLFVWYMHKQDSFLCFTVRQPLMYTVFTTDRCWFWYAVWP